jgi:DNA-binding NarL/FixJ family response regulator
MTQPGKIKLLIADDHPVARSGVKAMLAGTEIMIVAEVASGQAAVKYALEHEVDVALMDVRMPDGDGLTALGRIKLDKPDLPIVMLSAFDNPAYVARAVALGASGFLLKGCTRDELVNAITKVATGESVFTRDELRRVTGPWQRHA